MSSTDSVTEWIAAIPGDESAVDRLVNRYLELLVSVGKRTYRRKFGNVPRPSEDEEDAANSALASFVAGVQAGRITDLADRHQLRALLVKITIRKVYKQRERAMAQKRGGSRSLRSSQALETLVSNLTPPEAEAELADTIGAALEALPDDLRRIAKMHLVEARTVSDVAKTIGVTDRTVFRKLGIIRDTWDQLRCGDG